MNQDALALKREDLEREMVVITVYKVINDMKIVQEKTIRFFQYWNMGHQTKIAQQMLGDL